MISRPEARAVILDAVVSLLSEGIRTVDPETISRTRVMQSSYFTGMGDSAMISIHKRLVSYTLNEKRATSNILLVAEREANPSYSNWIDGGTDSIVPLHTVHKAVFIARAMLRLEVPVKEPNRVSRFIQILFDSPEEETVETFVGRFIVEEVIGTKGLTYDRQHLEWIAENEDRLLPLVDHFRTIGAMDRAICDSSLNGASALHTGTL